MTVSIRSFPSLSPILSPTLSSSICCATGTIFPSVTIKSVLLSTIQSAPRMRGKGGCFTDATLFTSVFLPSHVTSMFTNESIATVLLSHPRNRTLGPTHSFSFLARLRRMALALPPESTNATTIPILSMFTVMMGRGALQGDFL